MWTTIYPAETLVELQCYLDQARDRGTTNEPRVGFEWPKSRMTSTP